jgi:hypothetical protein
MTYTNSVPTSQGINYVSASRANLLIEFREISDVYCENRAKLINTMCGQKQNCYDFSLKWLFLMTQRPTHSNVQTIRNQQISGWSGDEVGFIQSDLMQRLVTTSGD